MTALTHDIRYAIREAARRPTFTIAALLTLGLGIGAVTTMYSVIYNVLLNPFPYTDPRRMVDVVVQDIDNPDRGIRGALAVPELRAFIDESGVFEEATGASLTPMIHRAEEGPQQFQVAALTPNSFRFLGVPALIGRTFGPDDAKPGAAPVAVLSYKAWVAYFGRDPAILGRSITLDNRPMTIIGVMPPRFTWHVADLWIPDAASLNGPDGMKKGFWLQGRLKPGIGMAEAQQRLTAIANRLAKMYPDRYPKRFTMKVLTVIDWVVGRFRGVLYTLFGAVGLLLLIACSNVANMLFARATTRERELAIRSALGATRLRIVRQLLIESLALALGGAAVGIALAYAGTRALTRFIPPSTIPVETEIGVNGFVLLFSVAVAAITALLFGAMPAIYASNRDVAPGLAASGKGADTGARRGGLRGLLVASEVALSLVLLTGAGVLMRRFFAMLNVDLGFDPHNVIVARLTLPNATAAQMRPFLETAATRITNLPGVISASVTAGFPPFNGYRTEIDVAGNPGQERGTGLVKLGDEAYFRTIGQRLLAGSALSREDVAANRRAAVVNETLAKKYFSGENPIGKRLRVFHLGTTPGELTDPILRSSASSPTSGIKAPISRSPRKCSYRSPLSTRPFAASW